MGFSSDSEVPVSQKGWFERLLGILVKTQVAFCRKATLAGKAGWTF